MIPVTYYIIYAAVSVSVYSLNISVSNSHAQKQDMDIVLQQISHLHNITETVLQQMLDLKQENNQLSKKVYQQETFISNISNELADVRSQANIKVMSTNEIYSNFSTIKNDLSGLIREVSTNSQKTSAISDDLVYMQKERLSLQNMVQQQNISLRSTMQHVKDLRTTIAFTATNSVALGNVGNNKVIIFNHIVSIFGKCYDHTTGVFSAVKSGVYVFYVDLRTNWADNKCWIDLIKNGSPTTILFFTSTTGKISSDSTLTILELRAGDKVWLRKRPYGGICSLDSRSIFSAYLMNMK